MLLAVLIVIATAMLTCAGLLAMLCVELWELHCACDRFTQEFRALTDAIEEARRFPPECL
jgi:hypothetical protein